MKVHVSHAKEILVKWIDNVVMPKADNMRKFAITFVLLQNNSKIDSMLQPLNMFADKDGFLDIDFTANNLRKALETAGGVLPIPYLNWDFDKEDLEALISIAKEFEHVNT